MKFFIITDSSYNVDEHIITALFDVDSLFEINKDKVKDYLNEHIEIFKKRALQKFDIYKTLNFINEKVKDVFVHDYTSNIIDVTELSCRIICIDCEKSDTLFYRNEIKTNPYLVYFTSTCGYNIIGNVELVGGAVLSALEKNGVSKWEIEKNRFERYVDCYDDIEDIIDLLFIDNDKNYIKLTNEFEQMGELFVCKNYTSYLTIVN